MTRQIEISALNLSMYAPHSPQGYIDLMSLITRRREIVFLGKIVAAMVSGFRRGQHGGLYHGDLIRFIRIDPNEPWFNLRTREVADPEEVSEEVRIPDYLLPHSQTTPFVFDPSNHTFYFVSKDKDSSFSPRLVKSLMEKLIAPLVQRGNFPFVEVTAIPDRESVDRILFELSLSRLTIVTTRPNPDDGEDLERGFEEKMRRLNARRIETTISALKGEFIRPDDELIAEAHVAARDGYVRGIGRDQSGRPVDERTSEKPMIEKRPLDPNRQTAREVLENIALNGLAQPTRDNS